MRLVYILLSSTFGMHQYTADLAGRIAEETGCMVSLVTTACLPRDRYSARVEIHTPLATRGTGFGREGLQLGRLAAVRQAIGGLAPDLVHITGVHVWNVVLVYDLLRRRGDQPRRDVRDQRLELDTPGGRLARRRYDGPCDVWRHHVTPSGP
jgi:hypothetical protein